MFDSQVGNGDVVSGDDGLLKLDDLVGTKVGMEEGLDLVENNEGTVSSSTTTNLKSVDVLGENGEIEKMYGPLGWADSNGVVEGDTERFMSILSTLVVEQVVLEIFHDWEQSTAGCVSSGVLSICTRNTPRQGSYEGQRSDASVEKENIEDLDSLPLAAWRAARPRRAARALKAIAT